MMSFASRFPKVAALLKASTAGPVVVDDDDDDDAGKAPRQGTGTQVDPGDLQAAFEKDAASLVSAEKDRWNAVLKSAEGRANPQLARTLLFNSDMGADAIIESVKESNSENPGVQRQQQQQQRQSDAQARLENDEDVDPDTGGGAAALSEQDKAADAAKKRKEARAARIAAGNKQLERQGAVPVGNRN